ncbi:MAG: hypothetical protein F4049_11525 [Gemmatimonadetes bacterium]|nr:hypothetical protein [Gemmatimonadota bacterium]
MTGITSGQSWKPIIFGGTYGLIIVLSALNCLGPIRCLFLSVWGAGVGLTFWYIVLRVDRIYRTHWFNPTKQATLRHAEWAEIDDLIGGEPLKYKRSYRIPERQSFRDFFALLILATFFVSTFKLIYSLDPKDLSDTSAWALPAGVLVFIGTVVTVFFRIRLTARTANRAEWIKSIRGTMTDLISACDVAREPDVTPSRDVEKKITELELLLNPEERFHRAFLALIRTAHRINDEFDKDVKLNMPVTFQIEKKGNGQDGESDDVPDSVSRNPWKASCIRLSNVILKYEWERVKYAE